MRGWQRWWPLAGLLYVVLFVVAFVLVGDTGESAEDTAGVLTDSSDRFFGAYIAGLLAMVPLLVFFAGLRELVREVVPARPALATLTAVPIAASAALLVTSVGLMFGAAEAAQNAEMTPIVAEVIMDVQYGFLAASFTFMGVAVFAACLALLRTGALPPWLAWAGLVAAGVQVISFFFFPMFLLFLWVLVASIVLLSRRPVPAQG